MQVACRGACHEVAGYDGRYLVQIEEALGESSIPVSVVWGAENAWILPQTGRRLAGLIGGSAVREVPDAGHLLQYDAPVALSDHLRRSLTRASADERSRPDR